MPISILNAGHGNSDTGAVANGVIERDLNKAVVLKAKEYMQYCGITVETILDTPDINDIVNKVNEIQKKTPVGICQSVHHNAGGGDGYEIYHSIHYGEGEVFAKILAEEYVKTGQNPHGVGVKTRKSEKSNQDYYGFIRGTIPPAIISEFAFLDNISDVEIAKQIDLQAKAIAKAHCRYYGIEYKDKDSSTIQSINNKTPILGVEVITVEQCNQFVKKVNSNALEIAQYYKKYGEILGIKWGYAFAQMIKETGYLKFGGDVKPEQNNFAGIGATGGVKGASFLTPELGVLAHLEHLFAYASKDKLPSDLIKIDPRFDLVIRGIAPNWEDLNGRWAVPGKTYGQDIVSIYSQILKEKVNNEENYVIPQGNNITLLNGGYGWIETLAEQKRVIIHANKYIYLSIGEEGIYIYNKDKSIRLI